MSLSSVLLSIDHVTKSFPGIRALDDVTFSIHHAEVHAIVGENGAGKSTLMKILAGIYTPDQGTLHWQDQPLRLRKPADAQAAGISIIYQEFNLLPDLTVAENLLFNHEPGRGIWVDDHAMTSRAREILAVLGTHIDPNMLASRLTVAQQQLIEIGKALAQESALIIMDEPTAALNPTEVNQLFTIIRSLRARGCSIIFISHRLDEVLSISDRVTVMKDGKWVTTQATSSLTKEAIVRHMVGRDLREIFPVKQMSAPSTPLLEVRELSTHGDHSRRLSGISFSLAAGEILGFAGLEGHGQREVARALFGLERITGGSMTLDKRPYMPQSPQQAIRRGVLFVSDDRKADGLALRLSVRENIALPNLARLSAFGFVRAREESATTREIVARMNVRTSSIHKEIRFLSGGNQQKTVLGKWLLRSPRVLVFIEPTRGVDVGAKMEIYQIIAGLAAQGIGIVIVSSEMLELLGISHRVIVMREGAVAGSLDSDAFSEEAVMRLAAGMDAHAH